MKQSIVRVLNNIKSLSLCHCLSLTKRTAYWCKKVRNGALCCVSEKRGPSHLIPNPISHIQYPNPKPKAKNKSRVATQFVYSVFLFFSTSKLRTWKSHTSIRISPQRNVIYPHGLLLQQTPQQRNNNQLWFTTPSSFSPSSTPSNNPTTSFSTSLCKLRPFTFHRPFIIIQWSLTNSRETILWH